MIRIEPQDGGSVNLFVNEEDMGSYKSKDDAIRALCNTTIILLDFRLETDATYKVRSEHLEEYIFTEQYESVAEVYFNLKLKK